MPKTIDPSDILSRTFGFLTVQGLQRREPYPYGTLGRVRRNYIYLCRCTCGSETEVMRTYLLNGHTKSCGCQWKPTGDRSKRWTGHGELSGALWSKIKNHARYRELPFEVTIEQAWQRFLQQDRKCALTGVLLVFSKTVAEENGGGRTASLDRIDSSLGYTMGNIQWVHKDINYMKMDLSEARFVELCQAVTRHHQQRG